MSEYLWLIPIVLIVGGIVAFVLFSRRKSKNIDKFFSQVFDQSKSLPKQKKNSFLLLLFFETIKSEGKSTSKLDQLNNPKYLDIQLIQMTQILKDSSSVTDANMKKALTLHKAYLNWEKTKVEPKK